MERARAGGGAGVEALEKHINLFFLSPSSVCVWVCLFVCVYVGGQGMRFAKTDRRTDGRGGAPGASFISVATPFGAVVTINPKSPLKAN